MNSASIPAFYEGLKSRGTLWAPVEREKGVFSLEIIDDVSRARPDALRTILPFKKLLLKPRFTMIEQREGEPAVDSRAPEQAWQIYLGAHACDIHALKILDLLYLTDYFDPYYEKKRENLLVIGYGCMPDEKCFCQSMGTSTADDGFDLFLTHMGESCLVTVGTARGDDIVRAHRDLFESATPEDIHTYMLRLKERRAAFQLHLDITDLPYVLEMKKDSPVWDELAKKCLTCGSCSMVCPTCSCFNVVDGIPEEGLRARYRLWDSCLYHDYALVAGGHNFRSDRADRVKNRYYHKQEAFVREFGMPSCVGCGRCIENCPTGIHVVDVFNYVRGDL